MRGSISVYIRTTSLNSCKYQEYMSFKPNLKEAYSSFLIVFFDCIRRCRDRREKTMLFNSGSMSPKDANMVFTYVLHNYFGLIPQLEFSEINISVMVILQPKLLKSLCFFYKD